MYLPSEQVKAFPLAAPRSNSSNDITSRLFYEQNVTNLIRQLVDVEGFIISGNVDPSTGFVKDKLCFNIYGYYFELSDKAEITAIEGDSTNSVYVGIKLISDDSGPVYPLEISGQDENGSYTGLEFSWTEFGDEYKSFQLLEKVSDSSSSGSGEKWQLCPKSYNMFDATKRFSIDWIDAKH